MLTPYVHTFTQTKDTNINDDVTCNEDNFYNTTHFDGIQRNKKFTVKLYIIMCIYS